MKELRTKYEGNALAKVIALGQAVTIGQDTFQSDLTRTYVELTLLNSFPTVNSNGMTLLPPVLEKSLATLNLQPLNRDHQAPGNEPVYQGVDLVVGAMIKGTFASVEEGQLLPSESSPVKVIAVLWNRFPEAQRIINSIGTDNQYRVSFEILYAMEESGWIVFGEDGPVYETTISEDLMSAWKGGQYDKVALAVGGDGKGDAVHIWGGGFTLNPADVNAGIDAILTGGLAGSVAIATKTDKIEPKEPIVKITMKQAMAKINKILAEGSGFDVKVEGGNKLSLNLAGNQIDQPDDFSLYAWQRSDGTYSISASLYMSQPGIDGFVQKVRLEYEPNDDGEFELSQVEASDAKVKTPRELQAQIAEQATTIAGFEGFVSPTELAAKIAEAVAAAKPVDDPAGDKPITQDDVDAQIATAMKARDHADATLATRCAQMESADFVLTDERKESVSAFEATPEGDKAFATWMKGLQDNQVAMLAELKAKDVEVTDSIKTAVAHIDSVKDSGFKALVASHAVAASNFNPSMPAAGDVTDGKNFNRVM
jgi:hypothetical protein